MPEEKKRRLQDQYTISIQLKPDSQAKLDWLAKTLNVSRSAVLRYLIEQATLKVGAAVLQDDGTHAKVRIHRPE